MTDTPTEAPTAPSVLTGLTDLAAEIRSRVANGDPDVSWVEWACSDGDEHEMVLIANTLDAYVTQTVRFAECQAAIAEFSATGIGLATKVAELAEKVTDLRSAMYALDDAEHDDLAAHYPAIHAAVGPLCLWLTGTEAAS